MRLVVLTGAGVSAESGVSTFRDPDGVWARHDWRRVATPEAFAADPVRVHAFYDERRRNILKVRPNAAHEALAALGRALREDLLLVTQNVDDLHERAGSPHVLHMHGELLKARCGLCGETRAWRDDLSIEDVCAACGVEGFLRPDVVWFGETPFGLDAIAAAIAAADRFVSIGTSGAVWPAAGFVAEARAVGVPCTEINLEPSENAALFDERRYGPAGERVPAWVEEVLAR